MELEREARKSRFARPNQLPDTEPVAPKLLREKAPDALEDIAPHIVPASPMMFGPNITGDFRCAKEWTGVPSATRAFTRVREEGRAPGGGADNGCLIDFYASRVHSIYGSSSSVQPPAMAALILIKS